MNTMPPPPSLKLSPAEEGVRLIGIIHLLSNLFSSGLAGAVIIFIYTLIKKDGLSDLERSTCIEVINFNISYLIYFAITGALCFILIGFLILPILAIAWFIFMIIGTVAHLSGKNYIYPAIFRLVTKI